MKLEKGIVGQKRFVELCMNMLFAVNVKAFNSTFDVQNC